MAEGDQMSNPRPTNLANPKPLLTQKLQLLLMLVPVILFTVAEEWGGLKWALILSVIYALGEVSWELWRYRRVSGLTLFSNSMVVGLSFISYATQDGLWFKLQPAILELVLAFFLIGSFLFRKPMLVAMMKQQGHQVNSVMEQFFTGLTLRMGFFFIGQAALASYASIFWSTEVWAFLKSVGILVMMVVYMLIEIMIFRRSLSQETAKRQSK
jgi:intracellular septation protein